MNKKISDGEYLNNRIDEVLSLLDSMRSKDAIEYAEYCELHDNIAGLIACSDCLQIQECACPNV